MPYWTPSDFQNALDTLHGERDREGERADVGEVGRFTALQADGILFSRWHAEFLALVVPRLCAEMYSTMTLFECHRSSSQKSVDFSHKSSGAQ